MVTDVSVLVRRIAEVGQAHPSLPNLRAVEPFAHYFGADGYLQRTHLDARDGAGTRREILTRFLLLNAVLDQGPDIIGLRQMLIEVTSHLYRREVRFLHKPVAFFQEIGLSIDHILAAHESVRQVRAEIWARENQSNASRYNLFMDNSRQVLGYAVFRWGVPLALPYLLQKDALKRNPGEEPSPTLLLDYLEDFDSAEQMAVAVKSHERYGLGKAIGNKAAHLFAKWLVSGFALTRRGDTAWGRLSYEVPYDSNAGRVLWRTGYLLHWATEKTYQRKTVLQPGRGKGGTTYLRVTNIRGMGAERPINAHLQAIYREICLEHLKTHRKAPQKVEIQRIQHAYLAESDFSVADFDDGLIYVGTRFCLNHAQPRCEVCPLRNMCAGYNDNTSLITEYRT
ncbi:MAG: hypothetical protein D6755_13310 [Anaerolineae bacterium]|nr:MAG: hypothetical protein D6755_13310 [Anaerolineae bacterium]